MSVRPLTAGIGREVGWGRFQSDHLEVGIMKVKKPGLVTLGRHNNT